MFKIKLSPQVSDKKLSLVSQGMSLFINGDELDFSHMNDGDTLPAEAIQNEHVVGKVTRNGDTIAMTILMPIALDAPREACFPEPITVVADGPIPLPQKYEDEA